jgi:hypothetical protein
MLDINRLRKDFDNIVDRIKTRGKNYPALEQYKSTDLE